MMKLRPPILAVALAAACTVSGSNLAAADKQSDAIDAGIAYLLPEAEKRLQDVEGKSQGGPVTPTQEGSVGRLAFEVYALVVAGVSVDHPTIKRSFDVLNRMALTHTYSVALYAFALDAAISQMEDDLQMLQPQKVVARIRNDPSIGSQFRPRLQAAIESFVRSQNSKGVWRYGPGAQDFDNSNVQFAVLALGIGLKRGIPIDSSVWVKVMDHFVKGQQAEGAEIQDRITLKPTEDRGQPRDDVKIVKKDGPTKKPATKPKKGSSGRTGVAPKEDPEIGGENIQVFQRGWDYENKGGATWNMTCAGVSSLQLARQALRGKIEPEQRKALDKAVRDGIGWMMGNWAPNGNYYGMYSLEKVGDIGEILKFGPHDWYEEMSKHLLGSQKPDGSWPKGQWADDDAIATAYALLILNRATSLISMDRTNKIIISGRGSAESQEDRNWVYVPEIDTSLHVPSLMRAVRLRPSPKLIKFLDRIVENYPDQYRGEIVPELVSVRDAIPNKAVQKILDEYLVKITGYKYDDPEQYMKWTRRWKRVLEMGESMKPEHKEALLKYYQTTTKSVPLKKQVMWALVQCKVREAIPLFLQDMESEDPIIRREGYNRFRDFFTDYPPPFDPNASAEARKTQLGAVKDWYAKKAG